MSGHSDKPVNVLITSAAAKVLLVQAFKKARGAGKVYVGDIDDDIVARYFAHDFIGLPPSGKPKDTAQHAVFCTGLLETARKHEIGLIIPTRDGELPILAAARDRFRDAGITLPVASADTIRLCQDKRAFADFCQKNGLNTLPCLSPEEAEARLGEGRMLFCRPVTGAGAQDAREIKTAAALPENWNDHIVTDLVSHSPPTESGPTEYSVDLLRDLDGRTTIGAVVRTREDISDGESQRSVVVENPRVEALARKAAEALGLVGHNTLQLFDDPEKGALLIEVNPRFGGAGNLGIRAGLDSAARLIAMVRGEAWASEPASIQIGMRMLRYKQDVLLGPDGQVL